MIRAKFRCMSVTKHEGNPQSEIVKLCASNGKKDTANAQWAKWTPCGTLDMTINNPDAQGKLEPGKHYFLDIAEAGEDE